MTKQTIAVEHLRIEPTKSFADVRATLERSVPHLDPGLAKALNDGDVARAIVKRSTARNCGFSKSVIMVRC